MILLGPKLLSLCRIVTNFAFVLRIIPFKWDKRGVGVVWGSYSKFYRWEVMMALFMVHQFYISFIFLQNVTQFNFLDNSSQNLIFLEGLYVTSFGFVFISHIATIHFKSELVTTINNYLGYSMSIQGSYRKSFPVAFIQWFKIMLNIPFVTEKYWRKSTTIKIPDWQIKVLILVRIMIFSSFTCSIFIIFGFIQFPTERCFISWLLFPTYLLIEESLRWWVILIGGIVNSCIVFIAFITVTYWILVITHVMFSTIFILEEFR